MERRAQAAEVRHQELSAKLPEATAPLLRQISALQDASSAQVCFLEGGGAWASCGPVLCMVAVPETWKEGQHAYDVEARNYYNRRTNGH